MTDNEKQFENFVRGTKFDDASDPDHRDRLEHNLLRALTKQTPRQRPIWRIIMKSRFTKLAAAAVIIVAVSVGVIQWLPNGEGLPGGEVKVEIPAELTQMSVNQLLEIHFGKVESSFDPNVVTTAVAKAMERLSAREILAIGRKYGEISAHAKALEPLSLPIAVEGSDFVVRAHVDDVTLDVSDLKEAILNPNPYGIEDCLASVKATIDLHVLEAYPSLSAEFKDKISFLAVVTTEQLDMFEEDKEYLIGLKLYADTIRMPKLRGRNGSNYMENFVCPLDPNSSIVSGLKYGSMSLDEAWEFVMDTYDSIHERKLPSDDVLNYWLAKLKSDDLTDCWSAVDYFSTSAEPIVPQELVTHLVERSLETLGQCYREIMAHDKSLKSEYPDDQWDKVHDALMNDALQEISFLTDALDLLVWVADESSTERILAYYEEEAPSSESIFNWEEDEYPRRHLKLLIPGIVRLVLKHPGPKRHERFMRFISCRPRPKLLDRDMLIEELGRTDGEDIDRLLMDMLHDPASFGFEKQSYRRGLLLETMARRGQPEFREYLEQFGPKSLFNKYYATPAEKASSRKERIQHLIERYRSGETSVMVSIAKQILPEDTEFIEFVREQADTLGVLELREIPGKCPDLCFVPALRKALEKEISADMLVALSVCGAKEEAVEIAVAELEERADEEIIEFLGKTDDISVLPVIQDLTHKEVVESYREESSFSIKPIWIQRSAVIALARLGGESAIPRLKELYESEDTDFQVRVEAALSLYYLGDETGYELLEHFVNGTARSIPEFELESDGGSGSGGDLFSSVTSYLRSPHTDALLLEQMRRTGYIHFFGDHNREILPILVDNLQSKDRMVRRDANYVLKRLTGQDFGFQPKRFVGQQQEAVERWRSYIEQYLAQAAQPTE